MNKRICPILILLFLVLQSGISQKKISLESIFKEYEFFPRMVHGIRSLQDGEHYTVLNQFFFVDKYSYKTGEFIETLFSLRDITDSPFNFIDDYEFSHDETKLLLTTDSEPIYRYSYKASYYVYDLITKRLTPLSDKGSQQIATFSPDGTKVAYMQNNNLFIKELNTSIEYQITHDGEWNKIINGAPDWVYEEEFGYNQAFTWSPGSDKIAFCKFDESRVRMFNMTIYNDLYPEWYQFKYPKAGEENSILTLHIYDLATGETIQADIGEETDQYIPRINWTKDPEVFNAIRLNRLQNHMEVLHINATSGVSEVIYSETNKYYISEVNDNTLTYLDNGDELLLISEISGWKHIHRLNFADQALSQITIGEFDIGDILSVDEANGFIYYSSHETSPLQKEIYRIGIDGSSKKRVSPRRGWSDAWFSNNSEYFILTHSDANTPFVFSIRDSNGRLLKQLENNAELSGVRKEYGFQKKEFFSFTTSYHVELNGYMIKPPGFNRRNKYPVFMFVYGGPESQLVTDRYSTGDNWLQMLAQMGYLVVCVDNRGTDSRGEEFRKSTYMELGKLETEDQIEAAKYLSSLAYVDSDRIGIFGWSYGGYMSLLCLAKGADIFRMAISVAPVTNWRFYDTIYTERFMRTPQENPEGYDDNSPINHVAKIKGNLLLVHGMADDNVHMQNSTELIEKLVENNIQFEMMFYPNRNHRIHGGNTSYHLYTKMTDFVLRNL